MHSFCHMSYNRKCYIPYINCAVTALYDCAPGQHTIKKLLGDYFALLERNLP